VNTSSRLEWNAALVADGTDRRYGDWQHVATGCNALVYSKMIRHDFAVVGTAVGLLSMRCGAAIAAVTDQTLNDALSPFILLSRFAGR